MQDPDDDLRVELTRLRTAVAKSLRIQIEGGKASPAVLEAARKFIVDQGYTLRKDHNGLDAIPRQPPIALDLPFGDPESCS